MAEQESDSTYRINGLYVTPNWNGNSDRVAMSCGIGANIKVLRKVDVVIAADPGATLPKTWNMTARNTILRTTNKVYLYARVERNGANGMYIWSENFYDVTGVAGDKVAVNNEQYYYIRVGELGAVNGATRPGFSLDYGKYGVNEDGTETETPEYNWNDFWKWDPVNKVIVFLQAIGALVMKSIVLAGKELNQVLTSDEKDSVDESSDNAVVTAGFLQKWVKKIQGMFLRKDADDSTPHKLTMGEAISNAHHTEQFKATSGAMDGVGAGMWMLEDGTGIMETDLFYVRRAAYFRSLTIAEVKHMGGEVILSAAACQIAYVVPYSAEGTPVPPSEAAPQSPAFYRCYFEKQANGRKVYNEWMEGDQARCQRFDADGNEAEGSFYWRLVVNVGEDEDFYYVDLSNEDFAEGSNPPKSNDNIVLFGHRNPTAATYDRTCAQMYSTVGVNAPSRTYYRLITSYDLTQASRIEHLGVVDPTTGEVEWVVGDGTHYIKYNTRTGLDIRTSSMTVIADGKDVSVGEALGDNFHFYNTEDEAPRINGKVAEWIPEDGINPSREEWTDAEYPDHVGDYLITSDGFTYEFVNDTEKGYGWIISSDQHLLHAQETADAAIQNLEDIANDNIITVQEKSRLNDIYTQITEEGNNVLNDAVQVGMRDTDTRTYRVWRSAIMAVIKYITTTEGDVELLKDDGDQLVVNMQRYDAVPDVFYGKADVVDAPMIPSPLSNKVTYSDCYKWYYYYLSILRQNITLAINRKINNIVAGSSDINQEVFNTIDNLREELLGEENGVVSKLNGQLGLLATKGGDDFSGFLTKSNYASVFASGIGQDGKELKAAITAYINSKGSGILLTADKIDFASGSVSVFTNDFVINSDGFTLTKEGNATFSGELKAATGTFGGKVSSEHGRSKFEIDPTLQSLSMKVALEYTESGEEVSTSKQVEILELGTMQGTVSGTEGNMKYQRVAFVTCRSYNSLGQLYHVASIDGTNGFRSRYYDNSLNVTSEVDVSAQGVLLKGHAILAVENITTIDKDDADHHKYLLPGQVYRVKGERTLKINV